MHTLWVKLLYTFYILNKTEIYKMGETHELKVVDKVRSYSNTHGVFKPTLITGFSNTL